MRYFFESSSGKRLDKLDEIENDENNYQVSFQKNFIIKSLYKSFYFILKANMDILSSLQQSILANISLPQKDLNLKKAYLFENRLIPIDWSLKKSLTFLSNQQFTCCSNLKSIHESEAVMNFSRFETFTDHLNSAVSIIFILYN